MEIQPLSQMLDDLLLASEELGAEICLAETPLTDLDSRAIRNEYGQRYARGVAAAAEGFGAPSFRGNDQKPGFPADLRCQEVTCWHRPLGMVYLALSLDHEGVRLLAGCRPRLLQRAQANTITPPTE